jgi:hypothetical protein
VAADVLAKHGFEIFLLFHCFDAISVFLFFILLLMTDAARCCDQLP